MSCNVGLYLNGSAPNYCINTTACSYAYDLSASPSPKCSNACSLLYQIPDNNKICANCSSSCAIGNCSIASILFKLQNFMFISDISNMIVYNYVNIKDDTTKCLTCSSSLVLNGPSPN